MVRIIGKGFREFDNYTVITRLDDTLKLDDRVVEMELEILGIVVDVVGVVFVS